MKFKVERVSGKPIVHPLVKTTTTVIEEVNTLPNVDDFKATIKRAEENGYPQHWTERQIKETINSQRNHVLQTLNDGDYTDIKVNGDVYSYKYELVENIVEFDSLKQFVQFAVDMECEIRLDPMAFIKPDEETEFDGLITVIDQSID